VNTTEKDAGRITEHVKGKSTMKSTRIKKHECAKSDWEKRLTMWMEGMVR
jgi:hypothetical protein